MEIKKVWHSLQAGGQGLFAALLLVSFLLMKRAPYFAATLLIVGVICCLGGMALGRHGLRCPGCGHYLGRHLRPQDGKVVCEGCKKEVKLV